MCIYLADFMLPVKFSEEAIVALKEGEAQLEVLRRQAIIGNLYPSDRSVME